MEDIQDGKAMAHDARHLRRLHPGYVLALPAFAFRIWSPPIIAPTPHWAELTARVVALVGE